MAVGYFNLYVVVGLLLLPFALYALYWRVKLAGSLVTQEDYAVLPNGDLRADRATFQRDSRLLEVHEREGVRHIPFDDITSLTLEVGTSRKIHLWLGLKGQADPLHLGIVTNHDLKRAGINGHLVAQVVADQGDAFLVAFRQHQWSRQLIGATFTYHFLPSLDR